MARVISSWFLDLRRRGGGFCGGSDDARRCRELFFKYNAGIPVRFRPLAKNSRETRDNNSSSSSSLPFGIQIALLHWRRGRRRCGRFTLRARRGATAEWTSPLVHFWKNEKCCESWPSFATFITPVYVPAINSIILRLAPQAVIPISHRSFSVSEGKVAMSTSWDVNRPGKQKNKQADKLDCVRDTYMLVRFVVQ